MRRHFTLCYVSSVAERFSMPAEQRIFTVGPANERVDFGQQRRFKVCSWLYSKCARSVSGNCLDVCGATVFRRVRGHRCRKEAREVL